MAAKVSASIPPDFPVYRARTHAAAHTTDYVFHQLIPYLGNKRKLLPLIGQSMEETGAGGGTFADCFAGSGVVSRFAKTRGYGVLANDWEPYAQAINQAYVGCSALPQFEPLGGADSVFAALNALEPLEGFVAAHLCPRSDIQPDLDTDRLFFTRANGRKIDAVRAQIRTWQEGGQLTGDEHAVLLASLLFAASYVSNTSGIFKGFHRGWGGSTKTALYRILSDITLRPPIFHNNGQVCTASCLDAQTFAEHLRAKGILLDIAYLDPPYNQHPYGSNYHVLNTLTLGDAPALTPQIEGRNKSAIRLDWRTERRSAYNHRTALAAYEVLLHTLPARFILTSYSTDGTMPLQGLLEAAAGRGKLSCVLASYKRYRVSSQRMSAKPRNIEFVLTIDTAQVGDRCQAGEIEAKIRVAEGESGTGQ